MKSDSDVTIAFTHDEALVLYDWLAREDQKGIRTDHQAEQDVLWRLEGQLERVLVEPLAANYSEEVRAARARVVARGIGGEED